MLFNRRTVTVAMVFVVAVGFFIWQMFSPQRLHGDSMHLTQAQQTATVQQESQLKQLQKALDPDFKKLETAMPRTSAMLSPKSRATLAPKVLPLFNDVVTTLDGFLKKNPEAPAGVRELRDHFLGMAAVFGDAQAKATLAASAQHGSKSAQLTARLELLQTAWLLKAQDSVGQQKIITAMEALAKTHPKSNQIARILYGMYEFGAADSHAKTGTMQIIQHDLTGPVAQMIQEAQHRQALLGSFQGKHVTVNGRLLGGKTFSTKGWKGRVIIVDFWATWCPPCRMSLPGLEKLYAKYHAKGLEVLGISNDRTAGALRAFLKEHPKMPWPQMFTPNSNWNPLSHEYGVTGFGIPVQFYIDRQGVVRHIAKGFNPAHEATNIALIKKLLAEK